MRQQLIQYVELLFAGAPGSEEIRQEILQNTLDRYDDLVDQGKSPEAAYRLAISGIGDISEILGQEAAPRSTSRPVPEGQEESTDARRNRAVAIAMYILSPVPLFILSEFGLDTMGLCFTLALIATATYLLMLARKSAPEASREQRAREAGRSTLSRILGPISLIVYLLVSFLTHAWYITWIIFPLFGCIRGLVKAILDLKEANTYEN